MSYKDRTRRRTCYHTNDNYAGCHTNKLMFHANPVTLPSKMSRPVGAMNKIMTLLCLPTNNLYVHHFFIKKVVPSMNCYKLWAHCREKKCINKILEEKPTMAVL